MMLKFIEFGIEEIAGWEETGLASVEDKKMASAKIFALSEGFVITSYSIHYTKLYERACFSATPLYFSCMISRLKPTSSREVLFWE